ncbi:DUF2971 domain-containing protein [Aeromonas veronii]|uniref:DUF2971 domain-containing protein n=1 Tax=Aeromonas veronii TaxID=654 RepID=UPI001F2A8AF0|nr:DUF2971 domain-containing protein [Aeromonas veronii]MCF5849868.1 DUF2971 domain-containing protein [Aeromonas veronii]
MALPSRLEGFREGRGWGRIPPVLLHGGAMAIYYKYFGNLNIEYFDSPTFKLTPPSQLNDPFESLLPSDIEKMISELLESEASENLRKKYSTEDISDSFLNLFAQFGIVSLSETQRNLLMWAHYANEHTGICIGYDSNKIFENNEQPQKVNYSNVRCDESDNLNNMKDLDDLLQFILNKVLHTKGDDWIYEKEFRYLLLLSEFNKIKVLNNDNNIIPRLDYFAKKYPVEIESMGDGVYLNKVNRNPRITFIHKYKNIQFLIDIPHEAIVSIYFGCRTPQEYIDNIRKKIGEKDHPLNHVKTYKFELSKERFELYIPPHEIALNDN